MNLNVVFTDKGIALTVKDKVAILGKDSVFIGEVLSISNTSIVVNSDYDNKKVKVALKNGRILAEVNHRKKYRELYDVSKWKRVLNPDIVDLGGETYKEIKIKNIRLPITVGDYIFVWYRRQAVARKVLMIRAEEGSKGRIIALENTDRNLIQYIYKENFDKIIGIYNNKSGKINTDRISIKDLLPYLKSYNSELARKIDSNFVDPIMNDYSDDVLNAIRLYYRELKIKKSDINLLYSDDGVIQLGFSDRLDIPNMKKIIHTLWQLFGNVFNMESDYDKRLVNITPKNDNISDGYIRNIIKYVIK